MYKKSSIFIACLYFLMAHSLVFGALLQSEVENFDEIVSLGSVCQVAWELNTNGLRKQSYPLDWVITSFDSLVKFIICKGAHFLDIDKLTLMGIHSLHAPNQMLHVVDLVYGIHSFHDFNLNFQNYYEVKEKYERRIKRFFDLLESDKKVLFIRIGTTYEQAIQLDDLIRTLYPQLQYKILVGSNEELFKTNWNLERIYNFYYTIYPGSKLEWQVILSRFTLNPGLN